MRSACRVVVDEHAVSPSGHNRDDGPRLTGGTDDDDEGDRDKTMTWTDVRLDPIDIEDRTDETTDPEAEYPKRT